MNPETIGITEAGLKVTQGHVRKTLLDERQHYWASVDSGTPAGVNGR